VNGIRNARYGQIGARPDAFWTCRYDEKKLQRLGPTAVVLDLSEAIGGAKAISDSDPEVERVLQSIRAYADAGSLPQASLLRGAKLEVFLRRWREANAVDGLAIQCWRSLQSNYGACSCLTMARFDDEGWPSACEADILGTLSMHASMLASGRAAALADWNNLHSEDDELANLWHCGVFPASLTSKRAKIGAHVGMVTGGGVKAEDAGGTIELVADPSPMTLCRVTQDPDSGWKAVLAQGRFEPNKAETWGSYGWCRIPGLQRLYRDVLLRHFPHHVAITQTHVGNVLWEALGNYLGMDLYHAAQETPGLYSPRLPF
jgi:L-fucose isomerase-like protein